MDMHSNRQDTQGRATSSVAPTEQSLSPSSSLDAQDRTPWRMALDHLAEGLRADGPAATAMTWAHVAQRTLAAAQHAGTVAPTTGGLLQRRMMLNDDLYRAYSARQSGRAWQTFDGPTLLLATDDLIAAEQSQGTPRLRL